MTPLRDQAIQTALAGNWNQAVTLNQKLLQEDPKNIEALNRLAFALFILGKPKRAKNAYEKVLGIDRLNSIAIRGLKRLNQARILQPLPSIQVNNAFLEETGKTKVVELINVASPKTVATIRIGQQLSLAIKRLKVFALNGQNQYVGMLPDNLAKRLIKLLRGGNCYEAYAKSVDQNRLTIFIRETKRSPKFKNQPSFIIADTRHILFGKHLTHPKKEENDSDHSEDLSSEESL